MTLLRPFHLAYPVSDLEATRRFYTDILGCEEGRSDTHWIDYNFFGHQVVFHKVDLPSEPQAKNPVDGKHVPVPHFGVVLDWNDWDSFVDNLRAHKIKFEIEPYTRFQGLKGEQSTCFFYDPNGIALEFKAFKSDSMLFEK